MTPAEITIYAEAFAERQKQTAYLNGTIMRPMIWEKRAPSYQKIFGSGDLTSENREPMTDEELLEQGIALNKLFGGDVIFRDEGVS